MNDSPNSPPPPFGADTDEALSALLDGELGAFAEERQLTEAAARARLEAWPGAEARLAELDRVRASMQAPVPALDDVTRRRLVRGASEAASVTSMPARPPRPWAKIVAVAAAGLILVAGVGVAVSSMTGGDSSSSSKSSAAGSSAASELHGDLGDLGDVTNPAALRALAAGRELSAAERAAAADSSANAAPSAPQKDIAGNGSNATAAPPAGAVMDPAQCAFDLAGTRVVIFSGTGTYRGSPVTVLGVGKGGRTIVFVVSRTDCANVLASVSR